MFHSWFSLVDITGMGCPLDSLTDSIHDSSGLSNGSSGHPCHGSLMNGSASNKNKRVRTSFKHHQLKAMKHYFSLNQNPDAKDLKGLSTKTGLTKRVLQVCREWNCPYFSLQNYTTLSLPVPPLGHYHHVFHHECHHHFLSCCILGPIFSSSTEGQLLTILVGGMIIIHLHCHKRVREKTEEVVRAIIFSSFRRETAASPCAQYQNDLSWAQFNRDIIRLNFFFVLSFLSHLPWKLVD